jgi:ribokinase
VRVYDKKCFIAESNIRLSKQTRAQRECGNNLKYDHVWPYVLPFPLEAKKRRLTLSILQSRMGISILTQIGIGARTFQHDLIGRLHYSNKSIIKHLKQMVDAGILEEGMERVVEKGKASWMKWYAPTTLGKWVILFLTPPEEIRPELAKQTIEELFRLYSSSVVEVCEKYSFTIDSFQQVFDEEYLKALVSKAPKELKPKVVVYGSAALDIYGSLERLPTADETVYVEETGRYAGGMGANVASALARLKVPVAFVAKIGNDSISRVLLDNLVKSGVDISNVTIATLRSLRTLILQDNKDSRWLLVLGSPESAISITSPSEIDWNLIDQSQIVYVGEVFVEMASTIANYAKNKGKTVVYRPGVPYLRFGVEKLQDVPEHVSVFIMNNVGWKALQEASRKSLKSPAELLKCGPSVVIITKGEEGCSVYTSGDNYGIPVPASLRGKFNVVNTTGAGDTFSAGLIRGLLEDWELKEAISFGQAAAYIKCARTGTAPAFPTLDEVEAALHKNH